MHDVSPQYPLSGVKVLELATVVAAPSASRMLCAYGADVVKVETLDGDDMRYMGSYYDTPYSDFKNPPFTVHNSNKELIALNLKTPEGLACFHRLLAEADILITNMRADALERLALSYEQLKEQHPRLIYAHLTSFGPEGPMAKEPGYDITAFWGRSGCLSDWPEEGGVPFSPTYGFGDSTTGAMLLSGILMALYGREKTGHGTYVSTSLFASGIWCNATGLVISQFYKMPMNRNLMHPAAMFCNVYRCRDGRWISIYGTNYPNVLPKFLKAMGLEALLEDPRYLDYNELHRTGAITEGVERCQELFLQKTAEEWKSHLAAHDVACEIVTKTRDLCEDPQALANGYVEAVDYADDLTVSMANPPLSFSAYDRKETSPCGGIGENTEAVLERIGYTAEEIEELRQRKVLR